MSDIPVVPYEMIHEIQQDYTTLQNEPEADSAEVQHCLTDAIADYLGLEIDNE